MSLGRRVLVWTREIFRKSAKVERTSKEGEDLTSYELSFTKRKARKSL